MSVAILALVGFGGGLVAWSSWREQRRAGARRRAMLDRCTGLFDKVRATNAPDGFPRLSGSIAARPFQVSLIPDTLAPKRLPQLWLVTNLPAPLDVPRLVITARPRGDDFISAATNIRRQLQVPTWLPADCAVRGDDGAAGIRLERLRAPLESAFADPRLKELAIGPDGMRVVYQACEGERGAHLLLRQARFMTAIDPCIVLHCRSILLDIEHATRIDRQRDAA